MASYSIEHRKLVSGESRYRSQVVIKKGGRIIHREQKTFRKKAHAVEYGKKRVFELEAEGVNKSQVVTLGELIEKYIYDANLWNNTGRTKRYVIEMLRDCDIANVLSNELKPSDIIQHCKNRIAAGAKPVTVYHDVAYLRSVMRKAKPVFNIDANVGVFEETIPILVEMKLIGRSEKRTRRPKDDELEQLREGLLQRQNFRKNGNVRIPFIDILDFSVLTCMRIGEVCAITWEDLDEKNKQVLVRNRKDPRKKSGNHMLVPLLGESFDIVMRQPRESDRIFPYNPRSVTAGFQRVRNALGITDLRYHDLRREGASRLFEKGYSIEEVAQVTGHRNLNVLWTVYTELFPHKLHDKKH
ncbi:site-specific integrase [Salinivibrio sp. KP-1]|uniref:tyrosine-type recombinase/integrase n=1 Tax=Salinivibrio sp. KP-1 TaxID=1406902 RepID=UPI00061461AC|nr:site-specific integrase [Salinivibrio sp. KP-1]KKA45124.1 integrase [Salinivibrio sp. KP-1]